MIQQVALAHGRVYDVGPGRLAVLNVSNPALDAEPSRVEFAFAPDAGPEQQLTVGLGERFDLADTRWKIASIENAGTYDYLVTIVRTDAGPLSG
jgi:hypothetical protein